MLAFGRLSDGGAATPLNYSVLAHVALRVAAARRSNRPEGRFSRREAPGQGDLLDVRISSDGDSGARDSAILKRLWRRQVWVRERRYTGQIGRRAQHGQRPVDRQGAESVHL